MTASRDWRAWAEPSRRLAVLALLMAVSLAGGWLLTPSGAERLPGPELLGQRAPATLNADRDAELVDADATTRRRAEASAAERPVYDHDEASPDETAARIHSAFALMREEETALREQRPDADQAELVRRYLTQRDGFVARLQVLVRDPDFAALAAARFSEPVEKELVALARKGLTGLVVQDEALLPDDREQGLQVRTLRPGQAGEPELLTDLALIRSVAMARDEVARAAEVRLAKLAPALRTALQHLVGESVRPTLVYNQGETERHRAEAAARVKPVGLALRRGERIVTEGEIIDARHLVIFDGLREQLAGQDRTRVRVGGAALVALLLTVAWRFARRNLARFRPSARDTLLLALLLAGATGLGMGGAMLADLLQGRLPGLTRGALLYLVPAAAVAVVARELLGAQAALLISLVVGLSLGLLDGPAITLALHALVTSLAVLGMGGRRREPAGLARCALAAGLSGGLLALAMGLLGGARASELGLAAGAALVGGTVLVPLLVAVALPVLAAALGYVTDGRLLALANLNHPALKELIVQAPGTYRHSIVTGAMAEAAARAIGADPLLALVGGYYHDLGKIRTPLLFAENQREGNPHDELAPAMSAMAIKRHVGDGLELARRWKLPDEVTTFIAQHHGSRLVGYFWAKQRQVMEAGGEGADQSVFRYPGPRPRSREVALVMLADACEASASLMERSTPEALRSLVDQRIAELTREEELLESELTLGDLSVAAGAMVAVLQANAQARPERPVRPADPAQAIRLVTGP